MGADFSVMPDATYGAMPALSGRELPDHPTVASPNAGGLGRVLFAVPFLVGGIYVIELGLHPDVYLHVPAWLVGMVGIVFAVIGATSCILGVANVIHRWQYQRGLAAWRHEAWRYDHHWRSDGIAFSALDAMLRRLAFALTFLVLVVPAAWVGFTEPKARVFLLLAAFVMLPGFVFWHRWFVAFREFRRYGNSYLSYSAFPFFLGDRLTAGLRPPRHLADLTELTVTLRCVQQRYVQRGGPRGGGVPASYELYSHTTTVPRERLTALASGNIPVEFALPADQPTTCLSKAPPVYWEIEVTGKGKSDAYDAYFLVPVYKRDGPASASIAG